MTPDTANQPGKDNNGCCTANGLRSAMTALVPWYISNQDDVPYISNQDDVLPSLPRSGLGLPDRLLCRLQPFGCEAASFDMHILTRSARWPQLLWAV